MTTPEGVPDDYEYLPPDKEAPDDHDVVESDHGGRYVSRAPTAADGTDDEPDTVDLPGDPPQDMDTLEARNYIFDHAGPLDSDEWQNEEDAAVAIVREGAADPDVAAEALIGLSDASPDGFNALGQNMAGRVSNSITGPTEYGVNIPYKTSGFDFARGEAIDEFREEYPENTNRIVDDAVNEWQLGMFAEETAPVFQLAAEQTGNETLPEGGRFGDDEYIDGVMEMPVTFEEKDAIRAKQEQTQEMLREAFGDTITVFRGQATSDTNPTRADPSDAPARMKEAAKEGDTIEHEHRPAESWTTDPGYASYYSNPGKDDRRVDPDETDGVLLRTEVPVEDVVMSAHAAEMSAQESEVVLAHEDTVEYEPDDVIPDDEVTNKRLVEEALRLAQRVGSTDDDSVETEAEGDTVRIDADEIDPEWLHRDVEGSDEYDPIETEATPEGVPEGYEYLSPDETPPDGHDVVQSPQGATYVSPEPVEEGDDDGGRPEGPIDLRDASNDEIADTVEPGDLAVIDVSDYGPISGDERVGRVQFIDRDWIEFRDANGQEWTVGTELVNSTDPDEADPDAGASPDELADMTTGERLRDAFTHAQERQGYRESGGEGGNTTGDEMEILEYQDGTRDFATPVDAYNRATTGVVNSTDEAVENNTLSPIVINELGGRAAQVELVTDDTGEEYLVKEGLEGATVKSWTRGNADLDVDEEAIKESAKKTMAAAYFVGNADLHGGNLFVDEENDEYAIIDHDSAGEDRYSGVLGMDRFSSPNGVMVDPQEVREQIYENALEIRSGEADPNVNLSDHGRYMNDAADIATRAAYVDDDYELDDNEVPAELQFPPMGIESIDDLEDPNDVPGDFYEVEYVDDNGDVVRGQVEDVVEGPDGEKKFRVTPTEGYGAFTMLDDVNRLTDIRE